MLENKDVLKKQVRIEESECVCEKNLLLEKVVEVLERQTRIYTMNVNMRLLTAEYKSVFKPMQKSFFIMFEGRAHQRALRTFADCILRNGGPANLLDHFCVSTIIFGKTVTSLK